MFYLIIILFGVAWILASVVRNYSAVKSPISHKYLNHGTSVPIQKCFNYFLINKNWIRNYSTSSDNTPDKEYVKRYEDAYSMKKSIIQENKGKSGIYMLTNKLTSDIYIGQSKDLSRRFIKYFNLNYINSKNTLIINRALIKYGYSNFSVTILEYCDKDHLTKR